MIIKELIKKLQELNENDIFYIRSWSSESRKTIVETYYFGEVVIKEI